MVGHEKIPGGTWMDAVGLKYLDNKGVPRDIAVVLDQALAKSGENPLTTTFEGKPVDYAYVSRSVPARCMCPTRFYSTSSPLIRVEAPATDEHEGLTAVHKLHLSFRPLTRVVMGHLLLCPLWATCFYEVINWS